MGRGLPMAVKDKPHSLNQLFGRYMLRLILLMLVGLIVPLLLFFAAARADWVSFADQGQQDAQQAIAQIKQSGQFKPQQLSRLTPYILFDRQKQLVSSNMSSTLQHHARHYVKTGKNDTAHYRLLATNWNQNTVVIAYQLRSAFTNPTVARLLPAPETLLLLLLAANLLLAGVVVFYQLSARLKQGLRPLVKAVVQVKKQNLDFQPETSTVKEYQAVLTSFNDMRQSLRRSLEQQWRAEQQQREQLAALTHDLKTPLAGAIGWTDLLLESNTTPEQQHYLQNLLQKETTMKTLIDHLLQVTLAEQPEVPNFKPLLLSTFSQEFTQLAQTLAEPKQIHVHVTQQLGQKEIVTDQKLLLQVLRNILVNAIDYTPPKGQIKITYQLSTQFVLTIADSGPGFTAAAQRHGLEKTYRGESSRVGTQHFGLGLFIAQRNLIQLQGQITLQNDSRLSGACVRVVLPLSPRK